MLGVGGVCDRATGVPMCIPLIGVLVVIGPVRRTRAAVDTVVAAGQSHAGASRGHALRYTQGRPQGVAQMHTCWLLRCG